MILAAGYGTRLRPYTNHTPKPLFSIAGRPLLDEIIRRLQRAGCEAVIINTHHLHRQIEVFLADQDYGLPIYTRYEPEILGTGGAIKNVSDFWDDQPFMVINADIIADIDLAEVYRTHCRRQPPATLVLCDDPRFNSVAVEQDKWVTGFAGPGRERTLVLHGGEAGLLLDGRGRPVEFAEDEASRRSTVLTWSRACNEYPEPR